MPQLKEKKKPLNDSMQEAYSKVSKEMPDVKKISVSPSDSLLSKFLMPRGSDATSNPFTGNVTYNPKMMEPYDQFNREQVMTHELTHTSQAQKRGIPWHKLLTAIFEKDEKVPSGIGKNLNKPYHWKPDELEAFQAERDRARRLKTPNYADPMTGKRNIVLPPSSAVTKKRGLK